MQALGAQLRHELQRPLLADAAVQPRTRERRVEEHAGAHDNRPVRPAGVEREQKREALDEVRCDDVHQVPPLLVRLAHEAHVAHLQVAKAAVDQLRRARRRRRREVALVDERDVEPVRCGCLCDPGADDASADHEQVELPCRELLDRRYAVHSGFVHAFVPSAAFTSTRP